MSKAVPLILAIAAPTIAAAPVAVASEPPTPPEAAESPTPIETARSDFQLALADITGPAGISAAYQTPANVFASIMVAGAAVIDANNDGWDDIYILSGGYAADKLYICLGVDQNGMVRYENRAAAWGTDLWQIGAGVSVTDFDADGWPDLYITAHGDTDALRPGMHRLLRNNGSAEPGLAGFTDVTAASGLGVTAPNSPDGYSASWADVNADGHLDVFVTGWIGNSRGNRLFLNSGDGTFTDATDTNILTDLLPVNGFTPRFEDINSDGWPDILLSADYGSSRLLLNDGTGRFTDITAPAGVSLESNGMGGTSDDFNNDGLIDWYVTSIYRINSDTQNGNKLYLNRGDNTFAESAADAGVDDGGWGWGAVSGDLDLDTDIDIVETNGWSNTQWLNERSYVFLNHGDGTAFTEVSQQAGLNNIGQGRGVLCFDADNDGDLDVAIASNAQFFRLYRNNAATSGRRWARFRFDTTDSPSIPPMGVGTRVALTAAGQTRWRFVNANSNYLSQSPTEAHFGLGDAQTIDRVEIFWPNGASRVINNPRTGVVHTLRPCDADTDGDHTVTPSDLTGFIANFLAGQRRADLNADARHDFFDLAAYLRAYQSGCPEDSFRDHAAP